VDAVVAEGGAKGVRFRYVLPYDAEMGYYATYKRREEREEKSDRLPQYFADALYELAAKYQIEITRDIYVLVNGAEVDKTVCYQKRSAEACARAIEEYIRDEWPRVLEWRRKKEEERRRLDLKSQVMAALKDWYRRCFKWPIMPGEEGKVVRRLELYYGMCEMAKAVIAEYGEKYAEPLISEYALRRAFWWEGEWRGKPMSCFVTEKKAVCKVGDKMATFYVFDTPQGVYLRPEIKLIDDWIKVAYRGDDS
jgi:hypothetical protein